MRNKLFLTAAILLSLSLLPAGCGSGGKKEKLEIRFAFFPNITHSQALAAKAEGQFQKAVGGSAEIQWKMFNAGPAEIDALLTGEIGAKVVLDYDRIFNNGTVDFFKAGIPYPPEMGMDTETENS